MECVVKFFLMTKLTILEKKINIYFLSFQRLERQQKASLASLTMQLGEEPC